VADQQPSRAEKRAFSTAEAATYLGRPVSFLRHSRMKGTTGTTGTRAKSVPGPKYIKQGNRCFYLLEDLDAWLDSFALMENAAQMEG
jgi:hypothetical protein